MASLTDIPEEKLAKLLALADTLDAKPDEEDEDTKVVPGEPDKQGTPPVEPEVTDAELDDIARAIDDDASVTVAASNTDTAALELANKVAELQAARETDKIELSRLRHENDAKAYTAERDELAKAFGIPPRITDLARPLLLGSGRTVELANGQTVNAGEVVRKVLHELGRTFKALDLSGQQGSSIEADEAKDEAAVRTAVVEDYIQTHFS